MAWTNWTSRSALTNVTQAASSLQLCARLLADAEAVIRAMYEIFKDHTTECILLIDAENAFNSVNRNVMPYNLKFNCLVMSTYISICYACPVRLFIISGGKLLSNEGTIEEDPTSNTSGPLTLTAYYRCCYFYSILFPPANSTLKRLT